MEQGTVINIKWHIASMPFKEKYTPITLTGTNLLSSYVHLFACLMHVSFTPSLGFTSSRMNLVH